MNRLPGEVPLFDLPQKSTVHLWRAGPGLGLVVCVACKASQSAVEAWGGCGPCPGWVESVPRWMTLGDAFAMRAPGSSSAGEPALEERAA